MTSIADIADLLLVAPTNPILDLFSKNRSGRARENLPATRPLPQIGLANPGARSSRASEGLTAVAVVLKPPGPLVSKRCDSGERNLGLDPTALVSEVESIDRQDLVLSEIAMVKLKAVCREVIPRVSQPLDSGNVGRRRPT
jgi:hypothetical protein